MDFLPTQSATAFATSHLASVVDNPVHTNMPATNAVTAPIPLSGAPDLEMKPKIPIKLTQTNLLPTPVKHNKLDLYLNGYNIKLRNYLVQGFAKGFSLQNNSFTSNDSDKTLASARLKPEIVDKKLMKELQSGRIEGPFSLSPYDNPVYSPLGIVPKKVQGEFRVIHHLSYPEGSSVNDGIPKSESSVKYASIGQAINHIVSSGPRCFLAKSDIQSAFRIIPISPSDYHLLGFKWKEQIYFDRCLPMGASSSCAIFERFSTAIEWITKNYISNTYVLHVLDDFLFISPSFHDCYASLNIFLRLCSDIGIPIARDKTFGPLQSLPFLGIQLNTVTMCASLPPDKIQKFNNLLDLFLDRSAVTLKELQSLNGMLNFACGIIVPARAFCRRLYNLSKGVTKHYYKIKITKSVKEDLKVWKMFLAEYNNKTFFLDFKWISSDVLKLETDASSTIGFGARFQNRWFAGTWHPDCLRLNIALLELYPIYAALVIWVDHFRNKCIHIISDNMSVVHIINHFTSKDDQIMILVRLLVLHCMSNNILVKSSHIYGRLNLIPDMLSRQQVQEALQFDSQLDREPTFLPPHLRLVKLLRT